MSPFARPLLTRPILVTKNVRDASMAARSAGLELFRSGGRWTPYIAPNEPLLQRRPVRS